MYRPLDVTQMTSTKIGKLREYLTFSLTFDHVSIYKCLPAAVNDYIQHEVRYLISEMSDNMLNDNVKDL